MSESKRKHFSGEFKAKVALEAIRGVKTVNDIGQEFGVHPTQVGMWKKELQEQAASLFDVKSARSEVSRFCKGLSISVSAGCDKMPHSQGGECDSNIRVVFENHNNQREDKKYE